MQKKTSTKNINYEFEIISIDIIEIDIEYQRIVSEIKVRNIIKNFDINAFGTLLVNIRDDGKYYLIDGQHRLCVAMRLNIEKVPCIVTNGLTQEEEANLFVQLNTNRYQAKSTDKMKARIISNDKKAIEMSDILQEYGLKFNLLNGGSERMRKKGYINNISCIEKIYNQKGEKYLRLVLDIISKTWKFDNGEFDPSALTADTILGLYTFLNKCYEQLNKNILMSKLKNVPANRLIKQQNINEASYGKGKSVNFARALLTVYNDKLKTNKIKIVF
jgi:hypothetical protein